MSACVRQSVKLFTASVEEVPAHASSAGAGVARRGQALEARAAAAGFGARSPWGSARRGLARTTGQVADQGAQHCDSEVQAPH